MSQTLLFGHLIVYTFVQTRTLRFEGLQLSVGQIGCPSLPLASSETLHQVIVHVGRNDRLSSRQMHLLS